jgi:hypothetical protein
MRGLQRPNYSFLTATMAEYIEMREYGMTPGESHDSSVPNATEKRRHPRCKVAVQVQLHPEGVLTPIRTATSETSLGGCYVETMFTFAVGARLTITLWLGEEKIVTACRVATCFPQVGNGIEFTDLSADDRRKLEQFLAEHESAEQGPMATDTDRGTDTDTDLQK